MAMAKTPSLNASSRVVSFSGMELEGVGSRAIQMNCHDREQADRQAGNCIHSEMVAPVYGRQGNTESIDHKAPSDPAFGGQNRQQGPGGRKGRGDMRTGKHARMNSITACDRHVYRP